MKTSCKSCGARIIARVWVGDRSFVETYLCGAVSRWGEGARVLQACPVCTCGRAAELAESPVEHDADCRVQTTSPRGGGAG